MNLHLLQIVEPQDRIPADARPLVGPILFWVGGLMIPLLLAGYALTCMSQEEVVLPTARGLTLLGSCAKAYATGILALACLLHLSLFWDSRYGSTRASARGKFFCIFLMGFCAYFLVFKLLFF